MSETESRLFDLIAEKLKVKREGITLDSKFREDFKAGSLDLVDLFYSIEEAFDLDEIQEKDAGKIITVKDAVAYIQDKIGA
jgi:acyl carrier protein